MTVKKKYNIGDSVWIYGINRSNIKSTKGKVIQVLDLGSAGYSDGPHYVIEIPTHIDPLLEIRTWENMSQDEKGPVGSLRNLGNFESTIKFVNTVGFVFDDDPTLDTAQYDEDDIDGITADTIHAALEKSKANSSHQPLIMKDAAKPRRRYPNRKKKTNE
jgi:hypothetical protein